MVSSVVYVVDLNASLLHIRILIVKVVANLSLMIFETYRQLNGHLETYYVRYVMYQLPLDGVESFSTKCSVEKALTPHEYIKVQPEYIGAEVFDPMNLLKLTKRLVLCTNCGNLRLIN